MAKTLVFDGIETTSDGEIFLRMRKYSSDGDRLGVHYVSFPCNSDIDAVVAAAMSSQSISVVDGVQVTVTTGLLSEGFQPISAVDIAKVKAIAAALVNI